MGTDRPNTEPLAVERLALDSLERGQRHDLLLHLADDGLGFPIRVPVIVSRGRRPGPVFGITAALHGNELNGLWVIHALMGGLDPRHLRGDVVAVVANPPGIIRRQRAFSDGTDLNRGFPGRARGTPAQTWSHRLVGRVVRQFDYLLDLHTAGAGRRNCVYARIDLGQRKAVKMATMLRPRLIVHKPARDKSLRGWASARHIPAVTLEIGDPQSKQGQLAGPTVAGTRRVLRWLKMLPGPVSGRNDTPRLRQSRWIHTTRGGLLEVWPAVGRRIRAGAPVGCLKDVFGNVIETYAAPADGWVIGKTADPVAPTGGRVIHLGYTK